MNCEQNNPNHRAELSRLNRIKGQIDGIARMIEEERYCPEILTQTRAVSSAIRSLETALLKRHLNHCVVAAFSADDSVEREAKTAELLDIFSKRLEK